MRVLIDYRSALRERSGVGEYTDQLVRAMLESGRAAVDAEELEVTLFSSSWKDRLDARELTTRGASAVDRRVPVRWLNFAWHRLGWPPAELLAGGRYDVTHSMHPLLMPARSAAQVVTIHDVNFLTHPERTRAEIRRDYPALARAHAHRADRVLVVSAFTAGEVERRLDVPADRITICLGGGPGWPAREREPADGYVLFFGTLEPRKNVGALLDAYERLASRRERVPRLLLAGKATAEAGGWLERLARPPLARVAEHIGYVDPAKRRALYEGARLLVQPSHEEGFGLTVIEAMTLGVPVVAADRGALPEVLGDTGTLVDVDNPEALAAAIGRMIDDGAYAASCAARGVARSRQFTWRATARKALEGYHLAMEHRRCASA